MTDDGHRSDAEILEATPTDLTLADVIAGAADEAGGVTTSVDGEVVTYVTGSAGVAFASLEGGQAEFRLDPNVARAALRTPDTAASAHGPEWVSFAPAAVDDGAVDRAEAWFLSAHRRASREPAAR